MLRSFTTRPMPKLVFGVGKAEEIRSLAAQYGKRNILLVTDPGIVAAGHASRVQKALRSNGGPVTVFSAVKENPTEKEVNACALAAADTDAELIVAVGGGSVMDTAKGANFIITNGGHIRDYIGLGKAHRPMLPFLAVPTTAGTGSECQCYAIISDSETHEKLACGDPHAAAAAAVLDPELTLSQPARVTAASGIDAIAHALESAVTKARTELSDMYSAAAAGHLLGNFLRVIDEPENIQARGHMLLGAAMAGLAIENSMLGGAHSAANPLTAMFGTVHGEAVGVMLPHVLRYNAQLRDAEVIYAEIALRLGVSPAGSTARQAAASLIDHIERLLDAAAISLKYPAGATDAGTIALLSAQAARQWTGQFNPRTVTEEDFAALYRAAADRVTTN